jgi:hypothetical protein
LPLTAHSLPPTDHIHHKTTWKEVEALINSDEVELSPDDQHARDVVDDVDKRHAFEVSTLLKP